MISALSISGIFPEISLAIFGVLAFAVDLLFKNRDKWPVAAISIIGFLTTGYLVVTREVEAGGQTFMRGTVLVHGFISLFQVFFLAAAVITVLLSIHYLRREGFHYGEYYGLLIFVVLGMFIMSSAIDLMVFFLGLELMSIALYIMVGLFRTRRDSNEAAIKYLIMGAFASAFILYGIALIYGVTGSTNLMVLINILQSPLTAGASVMTLLGMLLIVSGFAFKIAFVPFHMWTPDVYQGAPTPLTGFMSVAVKAAAYCAFITVLLSFQGMHAHWVRMLQVLAVLTMTIGNVAALRQKNIKRMLAYSSIAHAGYILVGIVALSGVGKYIEAGGAIYFYLVGYLLMNIGAFTVAYLIAEKNDTKYDIDDYKGLSIRKPFLAVIMAVFMFSLIGIPPFVGFMAKFQIFYAAVKADFIVLVVIGVLNSVVAVFYYLRVVVNMYMREPEGKEAILIPRHISAILILLALGILLLGLFPSLVMNTVNAVGMHF